MKITIQRLTDYNRIWRNNFLKDMLDIFKSRCYILKNLFCDTTIPMFFDQSLLFNLGCPYLIHSSHLSL